MQDLMFKFDNGVTRLMTECGAKRYAEDNNTKILKAWESNKPEPGVRRIRDGFQPGWQYSLGMYVDTYEKYKRICKERGLIEIGNDKPKDQAYYEQLKEEEAYKELYSDEALREIANEVGGLSLSGGDVRMLREP